MYLRFFLKHSVLLVWGWEVVEERKRKRERLTEREIIFHEIFLHSHILMFICLEKKRDTQKQENVVLMVKDPELKSVPRRDQTSRTSLSMYSEHSNNDEMGLWLQGQQTYFSTELPYDPTIPLLGTYLQKTNSKRIHTLQSSLLHYL